MSMFFCFVLCVHVFGFWFLMCLCFVVVVVVVVDDVSMLMEGLRKQNPPLLRKPRSGRWPARDHYSPSLNSSQKSQKNL